MFNQVLHFVILLHFFRGIPIMIWCLETNPAKHQSSTCKTLAAFQQLENLHAKQKKEENGFFTSLQLV